MNGALKDSGPKAVVTTPSDRKIRIERILNASRDRVWRACTDPEQLAQWWGRGNKLDIERYDFRPGGQWRFVEHSDHGVHGFGGSYREITPPERLTITFGWDGMKGHELVETMVFEDLCDGRTKLIATMVFDSKADRDGMLQSGMESGMNESYAALDRLLAAEK